MDDVEPDAREESDGDEGVKSNTGEGQDTDMGAAAADETEDTEDGEEGEEGKLANLRWQSHSRCLLRARSMLSMANVSPWLASFCLLRRERCVKSRRRSLRFFLLITVSCVVIACSRLSNSSSLRSFSALLFFPMWCGSSKFSVPDLPTSWCTRAFPSLLVVCSWARSHSRLATLCVNVLCAQQKVSQPSKMTS
jgi:hypothetical protein